MKEISIIIPCYNEKNEVLSETISEIKKGFENVVKNLEIIVVDDGSKKEIKVNKDVKLIRHTFNKGYGAAIKTGLKESKYDLIGITDADGTYPNKYFFKLLSHIDEYDMVIGHRDKKGIPIIRRFPKWVLRMLASYLSGSYIKDLNSGMRIFKKSLALKFINLFPNGFSLTSTITMASITNGYEVKYVSIPYFKRKGKSHISPIKDTIRFFNLIIRLALYFNPLRFFFPITFVFIIGAILRGLRDYYLEGSFGGLTLVLFFLGFQTFFFGLLAESISKK